MTALWTLDEVIAATGGSPVGAPAAELSEVSIDSREIAPGALFAAIRGDRFDGHDFVAAALAAGAGAALVSAERAGGLPQDRLIVVPDPLAALGDLGRAARARSNARIVAVTGSAGKTTTKEAIRTVLSAAGPTHASIRSFNNHWGVPLMLSRLPRDAAFGVFEIGMNHAGEITPLTRLVRPHAVVITTVAAAHLEFFDSVADIARAKAEIFLGLEPGGLAILNADHDHLDVLLAEAQRAGIARIATYGERGADWRIVAAEPVAGGTQARVRRGTENLAFTLAVEGRHMVANAVAALAVAEEFGVRRALAIEAVRGFAAPEGRGQATRLGPPDKPLLLIDQSYNANGASMAAALDVFARQPAPGGRKVLVLGDMLELGREGPRLHAALRDPVLAAGADAIHLVGRDMQALAEALGPARVASHSASVETAAEAILSGLAYGDAVMIKGSNGVGLGRLVREIRERFGRA